MDFSKALQLIKQKVKKSDIKEIHILKLKELSRQEKENSLNKSLDQNHFNRFNNNIYRFCVLYINER